MTQINPCHVASFCSRSSHHMYNAHAYSAVSETSPLAPTTIPRREPNEHDVQIEILFCGICHSDLHSARNEWSEFSPTVYPIVPGHEIVGRVTKVGSAVTKFMRENAAAPSTSSVAARAKKAVTSVSACSSTKRLVRLS